MVESVSNATTASAALRTQSLAQTNSLRGTASGLNTLIQTQQKTATPTLRATALAVPQTAKPGNSSNVKLPRGRLVDVLT